MIQNPIAAFDALEDAMIRITALIGQFETCPDNKLMAHMMNQQVFLAVAAHADLQIHADAMPAIKAFLLVTYGGQQG